MTDPTARAPRTHLIVGATGSVGGALARLLHAAGDRVVLAGRDRDKLDALAAALGAPAVVVDATDAASVDAAVAFAKDHAVDGRLDGAFHGVGSLLLKAAHQTRDDEYRAVFATHVDSSFFLLRACVKNMERGGSIVFVSSAAARVGLAHHDVIAAAKAAVVGLAVGAAATYASKGIRINVVAPGLVRAGMTDRIFGNATALQSSIAMHPLGRAGEPDDVARAAAFFLDPANSWVTGQVLSVDGGLAGLKVRG